MCSTFPQLQGIFFSVFRMPCKQFHGYLSGSLHHYMKRARNMRGRRSPGTAVKRPLPQFLMIRPLRTSRFRLVCVLSGKIRGRSTHKMIKQCHVLPLFIFYGNKNFLLKSVCYSKEITNFVLDLALLQNFNLNVCSSFYILVSLIIINRKAAYKFFFIHQEFYLFFHHILCFLVYIFPYNYMKIMVILRTVIFLTICFNHY